MIGKCANSFRLLSLGREQHLLGAFIRRRLVKTGARLVRHARYAIFQLAEAALPRVVFASILDRINGPRATCRSGLRVIGGRHHPRASVRADRKGAPNRRLRGAMRSSIRARGPHLGLTVAILRPSTATSCSPASLIGATRH